jgi:hypothetical protein
MRKLAFLAALLIGTDARLAIADPITYTGVRTVGGGMATLSITTDGTTGVLGSTNVMDWLITVSWGRSFTLRRSNSEVAIIGTATTATDTKLMFDFSAGDISILLFQGPMIGSGGTFYCAQTQRCFGPSEEEATQPAEGLTPFVPRPPDNAAPLTASRHEGTIVLATANASPTPEPTSLLLLGPAAFAMMVIRYGRSVYGRAITKKKNNTRPRK